jgi:midasin
MIPAVVDFYEAVKTAAGNRDLRDGANRAPHYSLRTLCRALIHAKAVAPNWGPTRALYEGACASFLTQLNRESFSQVQQMCKTIILGATQMIPVARQTEPNTVEVFGSWISLGDADPDLDSG